MSKDSSTIEVEEISTVKVANLIERGFKGYTRLVKSTPGNIIMGLRYSDMANKIRQFEFRPDDIVVMTYPKSGTTWMLETVWGMRNIHQLHLAEKDPISDRYVFLEADGLYSMEHQMNMKSLMEKFSAECPGKKIEEGIVLQLAAATDTPRIIKTHLPLSLFPSSILDVCKVVYVCRDPRDACVSYYHHCRLIDTYQYEGNFEQFAETFMDDDLYYGSYWDHITSAWKLKHHKNLHFVSFEDSMRDSLTQMKLLNDFLGFNLDENQLKMVSDHASFVNMKARNKASPMTFSSSLKGSEGSFFRKGIIGDWKNKASDSLDDRFWAWMKARAGAIGVKFDRYV